MPVDLRFEVHCPDCGRLAIKKLTTKFSFAFAQPKSKVSPNARPVRR